MYAVGFRRHPERVHSSMSLSCRDSTVLTVLPDRRAVIAVLTNSGGDPGNQLFPIAVKLQDELD
jgi:hypothetical protein